MHFLFSKQKQNNYSQKKKKSPKGHKRIRTRSARSSKIDSLLLSVSSKIADYRKAEEGRKKGKGIVEVFKRMSRGG